MNSDSLPTLMMRARAGDSLALGELLERHRAYLRLLAARQLDARVSARVDASDVVQLTFLEAQRDFHQFHGSVEEELQAWLRRILRHNVGEVIQKHVRAERRSTNREQPLDTGDSDRAPVRPFDAAASSPSQRAMRGEAAVRLAQAIDALPEPQREAIRLRYLEGCCVKEIAGRLDKSESAVAGLLKRGLHGLRDHFRSET